MTAPKPPPKPTEPKIALTVTDHGAQQGFQNYVAGVAEAFREKQRAKREERPIKTYPTTKLGNG